MVLKIRRFPLTPRGQIIHLRISNTQAFSFAQVHRSELTGLPCNYPPVPPTEVEALHSRSLGLGQKGNYLLILLVIRVMKVSARNQLNKKTELTMLAGEQT